MNPKPSVDVMPMTSPLCRVDGQPIPLLASRLVGELVGGLARLTSTQHYKNAETKPIEAIYTFPLPSDATVSGFTMTVEGRRIEAVVEEREEAFRQYDNAMVDGHGAALLEQERTNVFTANVGNLLPGEDVQIEIEFLMPMRADEGVLRLFVPTLVAPRYIPGASAGARTAHGVASPTSSVPDADRISPPQGDATYKLDVSLRVHADAKAKISSPSHSVTSAHDGTAWTCTVSQAPLDRDLVILIEPTEANGLERIAAHRTEDGPGYVALTWTPMLPTARDAASSMTTFVLDRSGSMQGESMTQAKLALRLCLRQLREGDRFQLIAFDTVVEMLDSEPVVFSEATLRRADAWLATIDARGGTELLEPLTKAAAAGGLVVLLTDGQVGNEDQVLAAVMQVSKDARIHSFGIGTSVSDALLRELASRTQGGLEMIHPGERIDEKVVSTFAKARARRVRRVQIETDGIALDELAPSEMPDIVEGEPWAVLARYAGGGRMRVKLSGELDGKPFMHVWPCELPARAEAPAVRLFWARERVRDLESREVTGRHAEAMKERIVRVAKEHGIASRYTSFVVVEKRTGARRQHGPADTRVVPVNAPAGWGAMPGRAQDAESEAFATMDMMSIDPSDGLRQKKAAPPKVRGAVGKGGQFAAMGGAPPPAPMPPAPMAPSPTGAFVVAGPPPAAPATQGVARSESRRSAAPVVRFEEAAPKESDDAGDTRWMSQLASGLWDATGSLSKTAAILRTLVGDGVTSSHAVYGGNVRKAIEAVARAAGDASLPLAEREEALLVAYLLADGPASRRLLSDAAALLSAALLGRMQDANLKSSLGL